MELLVLLLVVVVGGGGLWLLARRNNQKQLAIAAAEDERKLTEAKRPAEEDVTKFGEELQHLDADVKINSLDEAMTQDYERALDAYEDAKKSLDAVARPEEIKHVTEILDDGRYAVACVKARIAKQPLPAKLPPCFFNPAHGPSVQKVSWAPAGGTERDVPACKADAERVLAGADPYIRTVQLGAQRVPYWQGGEAYQPWANGYYQNWRGHDMLTGMMIGGMLFGGFGGGGMGSMFGEIGDGIGGMFEGVGEGIGEIGEGIGDIGEGIGDMFGDLFG
ncbi:hypothetical protein ACQBAU_14440 [Propionibacteriaceae bacterium Y2011]|uniref:hypothetical protein n=1 Tax=Microlunatus sp. Y2014 TaxID=3418488 RepID=UPI003B4B4844